MNQLQERIEKKFSYQDLVVWHTRTENRSLPIPGVVVDQDNESVTIRARVDGKIKEFKVSPDELVER